MVSLYSADLADVRINWDFVETGLKTIIGKNASDFIPADIYAAIANKELFLYWLISGTDTIGFGVFSVGDTSYSKSKALYIDHGYVDPKYKMGWRDSVELDAALEDLAKAIGCARLEFNSPRMGWGRRLRKLGWQPLTVTYKRDL